MDRYFARILPITLKQRIRRLPIFNKITSRVLARKAKRLDLCAGQFAMLLHLAGSPSIRDKVCLEIGSGWVLSDSTILHLLGAKRVIATDITPLAQPSSLSIAIHQAIPSAVVNMLSPFGEHHEIKARLNALLSINKLTFESLRELGIEYIAPLDLARNRLGIPIDFAFSFWVLEYLPTSDISPLLRNVTSDLRAGGMMIHCIGLEDDRDILRNPFLFYSESEEAYLKNRRPGRTNRIRSSGWRKLFNDIEDLDYRFVFEWSRHDKPLPNLVDTSISHTGEDDLRIGNIGVLGIKR